MRTVFPCGKIIFAEARYYIMQKHFKNIVRISVLLACGIMLATSLPSCKAQKCDCPTFGGHRLKH